MNISDWATAFNQEVYAKWQEIMSQNESIAANGFSTFYSPVFSNPKLLILGLNPGGGATDFIEESALSIPAVHEYLDANYPLASKMKKMLGEELINKSIKSNIIFFRTKNWEEWGKSTSDLKLTDFCFKKVKEMISEIKPQNILCEGFSTQQNLFSIFGQSIKYKFSLELRSPEDKCLLYAIDLEISESSSIPVYAIPHPTGSRGYTNEDFHEVGKWLRILLK